MKNQEAAATNQSAPLNSAPFNMDWFVTSWFVILHLIALIGPFYFFSWGAVATGFALYIVTGMLGITLGYHRLLTHRSFKSPRWVERVLATCGVLALQGSPLDWVAGHRMLMTAKTRTMPDVVFGGRILAGCAELIQTFATATA